MERIDLFDRYIKNQLSEKELSDFNERLKSDKGFAEDFKVYLLCVDGIIKEAEQDNLDFGHALKSISLEELKDIIGKDSEVTIPLSEKEKREIKLESNKEVKRKPFKINRWIWVAACYGILIGGGAIWIAKADRDARFAVDNAIYACAYIKDGNTRDAFGVPDITGLTEKELKEKVSSLAEIYNSSHTPESIYESGNTLAMAYMKLHNRKKAKEVLEELILKLSPYDEFSDEVLQMKAILKVLN